MIPKHVLEEHRADGTLPASDDSEKASFERENVNAGEKRAL